MSVYKFGGVYILVHSEHPLELAKGTLGSSRFSRLLSGLPGKPRVSTSITRDDLWTFLF